MTDEQINLAIAKACGWISRVYSWKIAESEKAFPKAINFISAFEAQEYLDRARRNTEDYDRKLSVFPVWEPCPNYCDDLNAMHEAESILDEDCRNGFRMELLNVTDSKYFGGFEHIHATARQRAEAFLRTLDKWDDQSGERTEMVREVQK
jgi:hypothetical protein